MAHREFTKDDDKLMIEFFQWLVKKDEDGYDVKVYTVNELVGHWRDYKKEMRPE